MMKKTEWIQLRKNNNGKWEIGEASAGQESQKIHVKHEDILIEYLKGEYEIGLNGTEVKNFIETYRPENNYVIMFLYPKKTAAEK